MYGMSAQSITNFEGKYTVWNPKSSQPPTVAYADRPAAIKVAHLMANKFPGESFLVCKIVGEAKVSKVEYKDFGG